MKNDRFTKTASRIEDSAIGIKIIAAEDNIGTSYEDAFTTKQQKIRDKEITRLLQLYVGAYDYKNKSNKRYKRILFAMCILILVAFTATLISLVLKFTGSAKENSVESVVQLITACITFLTLIVSILKIITKYVFPANDEEYITRIVEIIQNNDLENKKENIKVRTTNTENKERTLDAHAFESVDKLE